MTDYTVMLDCHMSVAAEIKVRANTPNEATELAIAFVVAEGYVSSVDISPDPPSASILEASLEEGSIDEVTSSSCVEA